MSIGYEQSFKGTETTGNNLSHHANDNNKNITDLYKQDSVSSDTPVIFINSSKNQEYQLQQEEMQHREIKIFMKKADKLNEMSYRKLHEGKPLVPEPSTINLYKSSKNILDEISLPVQRDKNIRTIYLKGAKDTKRTYNSQKKTSRTVSLIKRKLTTDSKLVQTDLIQPQITDQYEKSEGKAYRTIEPPSVKPLPSKLKKTLKAIEEDEDEQFIPVKRKNPQRMFNTISLTGDIIRNQVNTDAYLTNVAKVEYDFNKSVRRYSLKPEITQSTFYNTSQQSATKATTFLRPIVNQPPTNPWEDTPLQKKKEVLPTINQRNSLQQESKKYSETNKETQVSKRTKNNDSRQLNDHKTTENSLFVQNNNSVRRSMVSQGDFTIMRATHINDFEEKQQIKKEKQQTKEKELVKQKMKIKKAVQKAESFVQVPEVHEISIGTDTNNFILVSKKPIHPISIGFTENDSAWITSQFQPKSEFFKNIDTKTFNIKKYRNGVYFGELSQEGEKHGRGVIFYFNGRSYEGNFVHDLKQGKGFQYMPDGSIYEGWFHKGLKEGKGVFQWANGEVYDGQWIGGKKNGSGMWKSPKGDTYLGQWKNGTIEGFGVLTIKQGDRYEGEFKNSVKNGLGTQRYSNGDTYVGQFSKNRPNGQGQYYYHNADIYRGTFSNGLKHGAGTMKHADGYVYQGQFRNQKKCGYGEEVTSQGVIYKGNFQNDLKHGYGQQTNNEGVTIKGYWINGKIVETQMGPIMEDELDRQQSIVNMKGKPKKQNNNIEKILKKAQKKKSPARSPKPSKSKDKQEHVHDHDPNFQRTCGCKRKH